MENKPPNMGSARQARPVPGMVMASLTGFSELYEWRHATVHGVVLRVLVNPAGGEERGDSGETEPPQNPNLFKEKA